MSYSYTYKEAPTAAPTKEMPSPDELAEFCTEATAAWGFMGPPPEGCCYDFFEPCEDGSDCIYDYSERTEGYPLEFLGHCEGSASDLAPPLGPAAYEETRDPSGTCLTTDWRATPPSTIAGTVLRGESHSTVMKIDWTGATYSGSREWLLNLGNPGGGAEHWLWNGGNSIQFGMWNGAPQIYSLDIQSCQSLATTYDASSGQYVLPY